MTIGRLRLAFECSEPWSAMPGDERVRRCDTCGEQVTDISLMNATDAAAFLATTRRTCVRYLERGDGTVVTVDAPDAPISLRRRAASATAAVAIAAGLAACDEPRRLDPFEEPGQRAAPTSCPPPAPDLAPPYVDLLPPPEAPPRASVKAVLPDTVRYIMGIAPRDSD